MALGGLLKSRRSIERGQHPYERIPPLRPEPFAEDDDHDQERVEWVQRQWHDQDQLLLGRDRQVEKNIRMLVGQQWLVWSPVLEKFLDLSEILSDDERRWRQRPVINRLLTWFMLLHARLVENPPILTFQPASGDRSDAQASEVMDVVFKTVWREAEMNEVLHGLMAWLIPGGTAYLKSRIDLDRGDTMDFRGPAVLEMASESGEVIQRVIPNAPFDQDGRPLIDPNTGEELGPAHREREGGIIVDVLSPLEVRSQWGPTPFHRKRWHTHQTLMTVEDVWETYGVMVQPDITGAEAEGITAFHQLMYGSGLFGAAHNSQSQGGLVEDPEGYVEVLERWERPGRFPGTERTEQSPGGRLTAVTRTKCLRDGVRWADFRYTSPIHGFDFVQVPGRPSGTSPQEAMNPIQQTYNRGAAQILEHRNRMSNPIMWVDKASGIVEGQITNRPGLILHVSTHQGREPMGYVNPPNLGSDVWRTQEWLRDELDDLGNLPGSEGRPPSRDPSGELVKELRFNSDRFVGPTQALNVIRLARLVEDWKEILPIVWDQEKILSAAGEDQVVRTVTVYPQLFEEGRINVVPDLESMLPEGRGERQARVRQMWQDGAFGDPISPEAVKWYLKLANHPHMDRAVRPGGVDRVTAEQENGKLVRGDGDVVVLEWYDHAVHLDTHYGFMKSPEYLKLDEATQMGFVQHVEDHRQAFLAVQAREIQEQSVVAAQQAQVETAIAASAQGAAEAAGATGEEEVA